MNGIICCVCNHKGGVGKTSLACNMGAALALKKKKTLVIDNDPQANATGILLPPNTVIRNSIYELLDPSPDNDEDIPVENCVYPTSHKGLYCLPNVEETSGLEMDFAERYPESLNFLRSKVREYAKTHFDFVLIDCSPTLSLFVANALHCSDCVIVPVDAGSAYSLDGLRKVLELVESIQKSGNPDLRFLRMLINRVDKRTSVSRVIIEDVNDRFGSHRVFSNMVPVNTSFQQAEYAKQTIFSFEASSRGAKAYRQLAQEMIGIFENREG
jgi:chromosome partitioning protein